MQRRDLKAVLSCLRACDALVLGGGSLLQDSTSFKSLIYYASLITAARFQGKAVVLWAQDSVHFNASERGPWCVCCSR